MEQDQGESVDVDAGEEQDEQPSGFAPRPPIYWNDRIVARGGSRVERAQRSVEAMQLAREAFPRLAAYVKSEGRADLTAEHRRIEMHPSGAIAPVGPPRAGNGSCLPIEVRAFGQLCSRLDYGGAAYLAGKCGPPLRAHNVNAQAIYIDAREQEAASRATADKPWEPARVVLRTRKIADAPRSIFACVSPGYGAFDADMVAEALAEAAPEDAKGCVTYDGRRSRFEVWFATTAEPKHLAAGETFRAGVVVTTSDDAGAAITGQSVAWQSMCTNLANIAVRAEDAFSIRHVGNPFELARKFKGGFKSALGQLERFIVAWDYATEDDLRRGALSLADGPIPDGDVELARGIFRGLISGARASVRLPGRRPTEEVIDLLVAAWKDDASSVRAVHAISRASIVNAITRYAHEQVDAIDPWTQDAIVTQASALLWGKRGTPGEPNGAAPRALPFVEAKEGGA